MWALIFRIPTIWNGSFVWVWLHNTARGSSYFARRETRIPLEWAGSYYYYTQDSYIDYIDTVDIAYVHPNYVTAADDLKLYIQKGLSLMTCKT